MILIICHFKNYLYIIKSLELKFYYLYMVGIRIILLLQSFLRVIKY